MGQLFFVNSVVMIVMQLSMMHSSKIVYNCTLLLCNNVLECSQIQNYILLYSETKTTAPSILQCESLLI